MGSRKDAPGALSKGKMGIGGRTFKDSRDGS